MRFCQWKARLNFNFREGVVLFPSPYCVGRAVRKSRTYAITDVSLHSPLLCYNNSLAGGQEGSDPYSTYNPVFEMVYIALTLDIANEWREYLGLPSSALYAAISANLASLPVDKASPPGSPLYTFDLYCVCMYLSGGVSNPQCNASWLHPGIDKGTSCPTAMSSHPLIVAPFGLLNGESAC